jgi:hypothetical protein
MTATPTQIQGFANTAILSIESRSAYLPGRAIMGSNPGEMLRSHTPWRASSRRVWGIEGAAGTEDGHEDDAPAEVPLAAETPGHALADGHARLHRRH